MIAYKYFLTIGTLCLIGTVQALAQDGGLDEDDNDSPWSVELSLGADYEPAYTGSDVYTSEPDANIEVGYTVASGHEYFVSLGEIGARWSLGEGRRLSTILEYEFGRENAADSALANFPVVQDTVELQAAYQHKIGPFIAGALLQYDIRNRGKGTVGFLGLAHRRKLSRRLGIQLQLDVSFADAEHMQVEVGIAADTAEQTGYTEYDPKSGYKGATLSLGFHYAISQTLSLRSDIGIEHYGSIMANSPLITDEGNATNFEASLAIVYQFR